ncbi:hypothetical protein WIV_gp061 [Wiseana iridescent virus]|uniref:Uncharacterized protein n=1 Tax=Wiseana iridescent virus TaxID=68347 RepID=G0T587_IRV9|nr:hypothetical protein WIV_gp061 [Wiseana iridescent virus]ADO00404.1 hypothetical protein [Wiseana iridescent virus]
MVTIIIVITTFWWNIFFWWYTFLLFFVNDQSPIIGVVSIHLLSMLFLKVFIPLKIIMINF